MQSWGVRQWVWLGVGFILLLTAIFFFYYTTVQRPLWDLRSQAIREAKEYTPLKTAERVELSRGQQAFRIVYGQDESGQSLIAWVGEDADPESIHYAYVDEGESEAEVIHAWQQANPKGELIRIVPSLLKEQYVWEVLYEVKQEEGTRRYYDYYRFEDGEHITTYTMSLN